MRHGQTEWSVSGRHTGNTDIPLTADGEREAEAMTPHIGGHRYDLVLSSPLRRARETCERVGLGERALLRDDLREWDYGDYEGLTSPQIQERNPGWNLWRDGCPGGESPEAVTARCDRVVEELMAQASGGTGDAIVFAHGHILRSLAARWCGMPIAGGERLMLSTAAASALSFEHDVPTIRFWNRTAQDR
ncbi:MAG: histidine phosphatase family protein [Thermoleophilaceae bacterium]|nr:histidine phosphatase family protein [Thermoleophilaceae bacterium]